MSHDDSQLSLTSQMVELTDDEKMARGARLANLLRERTLMTDEHADRKKAMKEDRDALDEQIAEVALIVRTGKEERPIGVERPG